MNKKAEIELNKNNTNKIIRLVKGYVTKRNTIDVSWFKTEFTSMKDKIMKR
jgi:hypothetical protein